MRRPGRRCGWIALGAAALALGCQAPVQSVRLQLEPSDSRVYVDGEAVAAGTSTLELRSDRPHVVLVRREGYRPEQRVIESRRVGSESRLEPSELSVRLAPLVPKERDIRIEGAD